MMFDTFDDEPPPKKCTPVSDIGAYLNLLRSNRNYRLYLFSHICQHTGDWMVQIASLLSVEKLAPGSGTAISILFASKVTTEILVTPIGGILADRYDRRKLMIILDSIASVVVLSYVFAHRMDNIVYLYAATVLRAIISSLYTPVTTSITPLFASNAEDLKRINTLNGMAWATMLIFGGLFAGFVTTIIGVEACYLFDSFTFVLSIVFVLRIQGDFKAASKDHTIESIFDVHQIKDSDRKTIPSRIRGFIRRCLNPLRSLLEMSRELFVYLSTCGFGMLVFMKASGTVTWGSEDVLNVLLTMVPDDEEESSRRLGILYSCQGVGSLLGPILANTFIIDGNSPHTMQFACISAFAVVIMGWVGIANSPNFKLVCFFTFVRCLGGSIIWINSTLLLQNLTSADMLGRVIAYDSTFASFFEAGIGFISGILADIGYGKQGISYLSASIGGFLLAFWSAYHLFGQGAAKKRFVDEEILLRRGSIDILHSPTLV